MDDFQFEFEPIEFPDLNFEFPALDFGDLQIEGEPPDAPEVKRCPFCRKILWPPALRTPPQSSGQARARFLAGPYQERHLRVSKNVQ